MGMTSMFFYAGVETVREKPLYKDVLDFGVLKPSLGNTIEAIAAENKEFVVCPRKLLEDKRCAVVVDGFFEWAQGKEKKQRTPYYFRGVSQTGDGSSPPPLLLAGLYDGTEALTHFGVQDKHVAEISSGVSRAPSFTILTGSSKGLPIEAIHSRTPILLTPKAATIWLDPKASFEKAIQVVKEEHVALSISPSITYFRVSQRVGNVRCNSPTLVQECANEEGSGPVLTTVSLKRLWRTSSTADDDNFDSLAQIISCKKEDKMEKEHTEGIQIEQQESRSSSETVGREAPVPFKTLKYVTESNSLQKESEPSKGKKRHVEHDWNVTGRQTKQRCSSTRGTLLAYFKPAACKKEHGN